MDCIAVYAQIRLPTGCLRESPVVVCNVCNCSLWIAVFPLATVTLQSARSYPGQSMQLQPLHCSRPQATGGNLCNHSIPICGIGTIATIADFVKKHSIIYVLIFYIPICHKVNTYYAILHIWYAHIANSRCLFALLMFAVRISLNNSTYVALVQVVLCRDCKQLVID